LEKLKPALLDHLELSLRGVMEPEVFLEVAHLLTQLEVQPVAIPIPDGSSAIKFPILGTPEGMTAELWVARPRSPKFAEHLSLRLSINADQEPYVVEGASRYAPEAQIGIWRDSGGAIKNLAILATMSPDGNNAGLGIALGEGEIPTGLHYTWHADDPLASTVTMGGMRDGAIANLDRPTRMGAEPGRPDVEQLSAALAAMYERAKQQPKK
jgi:hypothetical protein